MYIFFEKQKSSSGLVSFNLKLFFTKYLILSAFQKFQNIYFLNTNVYATSQKIELNKFNNEH